MAEATRVRYPLWARGDLDGFFGLMVDNLVQVLAIISLSGLIAGLPEMMIFQRVLPGVAISLLVGNLFYGIQAHWVARRHRNEDTTALPYGINTPSVIAYILFVMGPVYAEYSVKLDPARAAELAWAAGVAACLVSGLIEFFGAFVAEWLRRVTPRAALLGVLAAVGITFIASDFAFKIFTTPMIGLPSLGILLLAYFAKFRFPLRLPGGFVAIALGAAIAWGMTLMGVASFGGVAGLSLEQVSVAAGQFGWIVPQFWGNEVYRLLLSEDLVIRFLAVSIPMGLLNVIGSLQNIESADAGGDRFATAPSLAANGLGTIAAGLFGSCFPTTIYIGHPGWKALGAKSGYSILNGLFFTACFLFGLGPLIAALIPIEAGAPIVMYIGIIITAQAFQVTPKAHAPAVAISLFPAMTALVVITLQQYLNAAAAPLTFADWMNDPNSPAATATLGGMLTLMGANSSWIIGTLLITAIAATLIDRRYRAAAAWSAAAAALTAMGFLHAYRLQGNVLREVFCWQGWGSAGAAATTTPATAESIAASFTYRAWPIAIGYVVMAVMFALAARRRTGARTSDGDRSIVPSDPASGCPPARPNPEI